MWFLLVKGTSTFWLGSASASALCGFGAGDIHDTEYTLP